MSKQETYQQLSKQETYHQLSKQISCLIEGETDQTAVLANVSAVLHDSFPERFFWVGFYIVRHGELVLGPFQGPVACMHIQKGRGVCGTAWEQDRTIVVKDVEQFPGHIACSSLSRSEIVIPLHRGGEVIGVLDIDSTQLADFDEVDQEELERIASVLSLHCSG